MMSQRACSWATLLLLAASAALIGQSGERHLSNPVTSTVCRDSAYLHGYIHGYEEGFRAGDLEVQMGHPPRRSRTLRQPRPAERYQPSFGNEKYFKLGFGDGFAIAYQDARRGGAFRGLRQLQQVQSSLPSLQPSQELDEGIASGYAYGKQAPDPLTEDEATRVASRCEADASQSRVYCAAFVQGFRLANRDLQSGHHEGADDDLSTRVGPRR